EGTTGRQRLSKSVLGECLMPVPPLLEQRRIASLLSLVQRSIEQQEDLIDLMDELKTVLSQKLFSEGARDEPQRTSEIGLLPKSWKIVELADVVEQIDYGFSAPIPKVSPSNGVKIVSTADISKDGRILYQQIRKIEAPKQTVQQLTLRDGDVLFNWRNS